MTSRVGVNEPNPTHHVKLTDKNGNSVGLILCNDKGEAAPVYNRTPVDRTALKTTSGSSKYSDFNYPYSPITQDDWSGGRGNLDFERDSTRFYDSYRMNTRHANKAFLGPQEFYSNGYRQIYYNTPSASRHFSDALGSAVFTPSADFTSYRVWIQAKKASTAAASDFTIHIFKQSDSSIVGTGTALQSALTDKLQWIPVDISASLSAGQTYYIGAADGASQYWQVLLYGGNTSFMIEPAPENKTCIYFQYQGQQYKVLSPASGAPSLWMNGDRGAADSNAGQLTKLIDATKAWTIDQWAGCVVKVIRGTGATETTQYRTIASNTATTLTVSEAWTIQHDTTSEYVIVGSNTWKEMTGHGLTAPVTDVLAIETDSESLVYFAQGTIAPIVRYRALNGEAWMDQFDAEAADSTADFLAYQPKSDLIWRAQNPANGVISVSSAGLQQWADLTWNTAIPVGGLYTRINGIQVYPNDNGAEALWVYKEELIYVVTTIAEGISLKEMAAVAGRTNGRAHLTHNVYSYFSLSDGLERYYNGNIEDLGPNSDEGLPDDRQGTIVKMLGYPGRFFAEVDGGAGGYSSVLERSGSGWHEVYRAPLGERLTAMALQTIPGSAADRLWLYQGSNSIWLSMSSGGMGELKDASYSYTPESEIILSFMHAGLYDTQKMIKRIKAQAENMYYSSGTDARSITMYYRLQESDAWTMINTTGYSDATAERSWTTSIEPISIEAESDFGLASKAIQLRFVLFSSSLTETPILQAAIVEAVLRTQVKYMYNLTFRVMDDEPTLAAREMDEDSATAAGMSAMTKLAQIESWADADTEGLLYMESESPLYNGKYVFINPPVTRQIAVNPDTSKPWTGDVFVCSTTAQEA